MITRTDWEDSIKFDVLTNWLVAEIKNDYISKENLKKLLKALDVIVEERKDDNE